MQAVPPEPVVPVADAQKLSQQLSLPEHLIEGAGDDQSAAAAAHH